MSAGSELSGTLFDESDLPIEQLRLRSRLSCSEPSFPLAHPYFEVVYGPLIGPAAVVIGRTLARHLRAAGGSVTVNTAQLAREVGLRAARDDAVGRRSPLVRGLERLAFHRLMRRELDGVFAVVMSIPVLPDRWVPRLPESARRSHEDYVELLR